MNLLEKAEYEFDLLEKKSPDAIILNYKNEILSIIKKFSSEGHSEASAFFYIPIITTAFDKLLHHKPISDLTYNDDDWIDRRSFGDDAEDFIAYQHKRDYSVFKENSGKIYSINRVKLKVFSADYAGRMTQETYTNKGFYADETAAQNRDKSKYFENKIYLKDNRSYFGDITIYCGVIDVEGSDQIFYSKFPEQLEFINRHYILK